MSGDRPPPPGGVLNIIAELTETYFGQSGFSPERPKFMKLSEKYGFAEDLCDILYDAGWRFTNATAYEQIARSIKVPEAPQKTRQRPEDEMFHDGTG
jgi:hypothetical protein